MDKKRVLIIVGIPNFNYANEKSAVSNFLLEIYKAFQLQGFEVDFSNTNESSGVETVVVENKRGLKNKIKSLVKKWPWLYSTIVYKFYFKNQDAIINDVDEKAVYSHIIEFHTVGSVLGKQLAKYYKAKLSIIFDSPVDEQFHEMHHTKTFFWNKIKRSEQLTLEAADTIMVYSNACEKYISNKYNLSAAINILPCVLNKPAVTNDPNSNFIIGFIGSFLSWHKVDLLVKAFAIFNKTINNKAKLYLIGFGEEWGKVRQLVVDLKLEDAVEMPGFVSELELVKYKKEMSVAVMSGSNWYGSPLKLFEYAQCGIPFIAPSSKTIVSIFKENEHCLYVDPSNEESSLVTHLTYLYENTGARVNMGKRVKDFYDSNYAETVYSKKLYEALK